MWGPVELDEAPNGAIGDKVTVPGRSWFSGLRIYGPLEPWINKTWQPGDVELVE